MRVLLVIDHFGSGGAQRQIVELACGLHRRGHNVEMFVYHPEHDFFRPRLDAQGIVVHQYSKGKGFSFEVLLRLILLMRTSTDIVLSYLNSANIYAELAKLISGGPKLIVSERTSYHDDKSRLGAYGRRLLHTIADEVVANSHTQSDWLKQRRWLRGKVTCIYNGVDTNQFSAEPFVPESPRDLRLMAMGRVGPEKNVLNLIGALNLLHERCGYVPQITWVGRRDKSCAEGNYCRKVDCLLDSLPAIRERWHWLGVQSDVPQVFREHHALIHPSFYEGLPNVVCEALATAKPVLISNVCDHPRLIASGERGFLFNPREPESIAEAIQMLGELDKWEWLRFSRNAREYAVTNLGLEKMVTSYESLFKGLADTSADTAAGSE